MKKKMPDFSVVMATYTGAATIDSVFKSLISQKDPGSKFEIIVVIDGPSEELRKKVEESAAIFKKQKIDFIVEQFPKNKGRFEARLAGARKAKYKYLLIADDRVELPDNYFKTVVAAEKEAVMPDVVEKEAANFVSMTLHRLRRKIYGERWSSDFKPYYIDKNNFDKSPKGTAAFWVSKNDFIDACAQIAKQTSQTKNVNEDTRILRYLIDKGVKIYKTSKLRIIYEPRATASEELSHVYHRGPRFIDYYLKPGNRYFFPLVAFYVLLIPTVILFIVWPVIALVLLLLSLALSFWTSTKLQEAYKVFIGLWLVFIFFCAGLISGLYKKVVS